MQAQARAANPPEAQPTYSVAERNARRRASRGTPGQGAARQNFYGEPAMMIGSAIVAEPLSGLAGLAGTVLPGQQGQGADWVRRTQDFLTYQPKTEEGKAGTQALGDSFVGDIGRGFVALSEGAGDTVYDVTGSPALAAAAYSAPTAVLEALGLKGLRKASTPGRKIFAGAKSKTADMKKMKAAQELAKRGISKEEIWNKTGWFEDVDGQWKYEIPDNQMTYKGKDHGVTQAQAVREWEGMEGRPITMGEMYDHPALFAAYPELKDMPIKPNEGAIGGYSPKNKDITVGTELGLTPDDTLQKQVLHETSHRIQGDEGMARGGAPSEFMDDLVKRKEDADIVIKDANEQMRRNVEIRDRLEADGASPEILAPYEKDYQDLIAQKMAVLDDAQIDPLIDSTKQYEKLAGEAEARVVSHRMQMTDAERAAEPPWQTLERMEGLKPEDLIVRLESGANTPQQMAAVTEIKKRMSDNQSIKASATVTDQPRREVVPADGVTRAAVGGTEGINKEFYKGGQFLPSTTAPKGTWRIKQNGKSKKVSGQHWLIEAGRKEAPPTPFSVGIYQGIMRYVDEMPDGKLKIKDDIDLEMLGLDKPEKMRFKNLAESDESFTLQDRIDMYNEGARWVDLEPAEGVEILVKGDGDKAAKPFNKSTIGFAPSDVDKYSGAIPKDPGMGTAGQVQGKIQRAVSKRTQQTGIQAEDELAKEEARKQAQRKKRKK